MHEFYGAMLDLIEKTNEAIAHLKIAADLEPYSPAYIRHYGLVLLGARRYSEARGRFEECVGIQQSPMNLWGVSDVLLGLGQIERAIDVGTPEEAKSAANSFSRDVTVQKPVGCRLHASSHGHSSTTRIELLNL